MVSLRGVGEGVGGTEVELSQARVVLEVVRCSAGVGDGVGIVPPQLFLVGR